MKQLSQLVKANGVYTERVHKPANTYYSVYSIGGHKPACMCWTSVFHSYLFPFHTAEFLDHVRQQFIAVVDASTIVLELEHRGIISNGDQRTIRQEANATLQAQLLHACLKKTCDAKALTDVCDIIATVKGNPRMKLFGEHMKTEWEKGELVIK